jgi:hypothetical protein
MARSNTGSYYSKQPSGSRRISLPVPQGNRIVEWLLGMPGGRLLNHLIHYGSSWSR